MKVLYQKSNSREGRRYSVIQVNDDNCDSIRAIADSTFSYARFFGKKPEQKIQYIVKQPQTSISFHDAKAAYEEEARIWDLVHPDRKADLIVDADGRELLLVLPCPPGDPISKYDSETSDPLTSCQQLLAVVAALKKFEELGYCFGDFKSDKIFLEKNSDDTFKAHLVGFENVHKVAEFQPNTHWTWLNAFSNAIPNLPNHNYHSFAELAQDLSVEIGELGKKKQLVQT